MRLLLITIGSCLFLGCTGPQELSELSVESVVSNYNVESLTSQSITPGVYSKLRKIREYRLSFDASFLEESRIIGLCVDSVLVPLTLFKHNENRMESQTIAKGSEGIFKFNAIRNFYNPEAPDRGNEMVIYQSIPDTLTKRHACLLLESKGQQLCIDLGEIEQLEPILAP